MSVTGRGRAAKQWLWQATPNTLRQWERLRDEVRYLNPASPRARELRDEIRLLPGYPTDASPRDTILIERIPPVISIGTPQPKVN